MRTMMKHGERLLNQVRNRRKLPNIEHGEKRMKNFLKNRSRCFKNFTGNETCKTIFALLRIGMSAVFVCTMEANFIFLITPKSAWKMSLPRRNVNVFQIGRAHV